MVHPPRGNAGSRLYQKDGTIFFSVKAPLTSRRRGYFGAQPESFGERTMSGRVARLKDGVDGE